LTALLFGLGKESVWLALDSLACSKGGAPLKYVVKVFPFPHLNLVMCGTGDMNIILDWFVALNAYYYGQSGRHLGLPHVNDGAPAVLSGIALKYEHLKAGSTTIYHFGFDETEKRFRGFAFRSTNEFAMDEIPYGLGAKPFGEELAPLLYGSGGPPTVNSIIRVMEEQKRRDEALPAEDRVGVGGEIHLLTMSENRQTLWACHRFKDRATMFDEILEGLRDTKQTPQGSETQ